ncbi:MAG: sn-glycerol-3-phosphate ABC transporter ATP-binding protein UgpC [Pseudomonadota bacterium]
MAQVEIRDVDKFYGDVQAIDAVSLDIDDGDFVILVGPSGCGKSTLLRMVAGLEDISYGDISIGGKVVTTLPPKDRDTAMVFQNYALYPHMTVAENMGFSLRLKGEAKSIARQKVGDTAEILGLSDLLDRYPRQLSGGQRQRVAMGRAIVRKPAVFLFDEPLSNLDAKLRVQMRAEIRELQQRLNTTTIYVTHDQIEAMTMADKIVVMQNGVIEQVGSPLDLYDRPGNTFIASFIGSPSMNLIAGKMTEDGFLSHFDDLLPVPEERRHLSATTYGIRPEHLLLDPDGLEMTVAVVETMGFETHLLGMLGETKITVLTNERVNAGLGDVIPVRPDPHNAHLFDATGTRIA